MLNWFRNTLGEGRGEGAYFFAVSLFFLPWGFFFCREAFFCRMSFPFPVSFFLLPWSYFFGCEVISFAATIVGYRNLPFRDHIELRHQRLSLQRVSSKCVLPGSFQRDVKPHYASTKLTTTTDVNAIILHTPYWTLLCTGARNDT